MSSLPRVSTFLAILLVAVPAVARLVSADRPTDPRLNPLNWDELQSETAALSRVHAEVTERHTFNRQLLTRLAAGHVSLAEAAAAHWAVNRETVGFKESIPTYPGITDLDTRERLNVLRLVQVHILDQPDADRVMARLVAEYERTWGPFPLRSVDDLPGDDRAGVSRVSKRPAAPGSAHDLPSRHRRTAQ